MTLRAGNSIRQHAAEAGPLLPAQEAHWELLCALSPDDPGCSRQIIFDCRQLDGRLDVGALMRAFAAVARRHESLRVVFESSGPDPEVRIAQGQELPAEFLDLSGLGRAQRQDRVDDLIFTETMRCFDLRTGPLWHAWVVRLGATCHWLVLCLSHIIADGWSGKVFLDDLFAAYRAQIGGGPALDDDDVPSLAEIGHRQRARLRPLPERLRYWRDRLVALPGQSLFPPPAVPDADMLARTVVSFSLRPDIAAQVRRLAWKSRTTPFIALMAAHHLQLALALGKSHTVLSTAAMAGVPGRERKAICQHAADAYVALDVADEHCLIDVVRHTHEAMAGALGNMAPFKAVARVVNPAFDSSRPWPDPRMFDGNFIDGAFDPVELMVAGVRVARPVLHRSERRPDCYPQLRWSGLPDASRVVWETISGPGFEVNPARDGGVVHYNEQVIPTERMREFVDQYVWITGMLASSPQTTVRALRDQHARGPAC